MVLRIYSMNLMAKPNCRHWALLTQEAVVLPIVCELKRFMIDSNFLLYCVPSDRAHHHKQLDSESWKTWQWGQNWSMITAEHSSSNRLLMSDDN